MSRKHTSGKSDNVIIAHIRAGKHFSEQAESCFQAALELLMTEYLDSIYGFFENQLPRPLRGKAEDFAEEVFLAAYKAMPAFLERSSIKTWLWRIVHNKYADAVEKYVDEVKEVRNYMVLSRTGHVNFVEDYERKEMRNAMLNALHALSLEDRLVIAIRIHGVITASELAEILGIQQVSLRKRYQRARKHLGKIMEEYENS